jgi:hypothetical protein
MPSRPDLREIASHVRDAFAEMDRDTLLEILTFVVKEYVVEGPPPMLVHQAETLADLQGASFAQIISALQTRFDHPELQMFVVDGDQVSVRVGGVMQPLIAGRQPMQAPAAELPRPAAGVRVVETTLQPRPPQAAPAQQAGSAPPPVRGLAVRGRPSGEGGEPGAPPQGAQPAAPASAAPASAAPAENKDKPEGGDDSSARFSLLELD